MNARRFLGAPLLPCLLLALGALGFTGCAATKIQPWDRDLLAEQKMQFAPSPVENEIDQHIYFSKEASTGGAGVGGGGCGCN
ncbi:MAG: DUF4266 domain-containing protein [Candidatus Eisenbacteria bacterium]